MVLWNACVPEKVKICAWRACLDSLSTRMNLSKRRDSTDEACGVCGGQVESTKHVFRECNLARAIWFRSLGVRVDTGHRLPLMLWLENISMSFPTNGFEFCLMLIWSLWKHRNDVIWNGISLPPHELVT